MQHIFPDYFIYLFIFSYSSISVYAPMLECVHAMECMQSTEDRFQESILSYHVGP